MSVLHGIHITRPNEENIYKAKYHTILHMYIHSHINIQYGVCTYNLSFVLQL